MTGVYQQHAQNLNQGVSLQRKDVPLNAWKTGRVTRISAALPPARPHGLTGSPHPSVPQLHTGTGALTANDAPTQPPKAGLSPAYPEALRPPTPDTVRASASPGHTP